MRDLVVLVADSHCQQSLFHLLQRHQALNIRKIALLRNDVLVHPEHDGGCRVSGTALLRNFLRNYEHALLVFDHEGCGYELRQSAEELERQLDGELESSGWLSGRARTVVIEPELEAWVWSQSTAVDEILGWSGRLPGLSVWLSQQGFVQSVGEKPRRPKEALEAALKEVRKQPSAAIFGNLARAVSVNRCSDRAFLRLRAVLQEWFGA